MYKRVMAYLMTFCMLCGMMPMTVSASEQESVSGNEVFLDADACMDAAQAGGSEVQSETFAADEQGEVLYSGEESGVTWKITSDGVLTISGEKLAGEPNPGGSAWKAHKEEFTKVVVTAKNIESTAEWFNGCSGIAEMDLSGFDVSHVTDMTMMFYGCKGLTDLDLSSWDTQNVVKMGYMFGDAQHLVNLDVSGWNTGNVATMQGMFYCCHSLTSLDLSSWDMGKVTNTYKMFEQCRNITRIKTFANLQSDIELPTHIRVDEKGNTYNQFPKDLPEGIWLYARILYDGEESGIVWIITYDGVLTIEGEKPEGEPDPDGSAWKAHKDEFTKAVVTAKNIESTAGWFEDCEGLTEVDLSEFDTAKLVKADNMFKGCSGITQIKTFPNLQLQIALPLPVMYDEYRNEYKTYFPTALAEGIYLYADAGKDVLYSGTESGVTWEITSDGVLTISGEKLAGEKNPDGSVWKAYKDEFTKVVVTAKNVESTADWFSGCSGIIEMDLSGFDASHVTDMSHMFWGCKGLTDLDLSSWNTENVVNMSEMFNGAMNLVNLDVSGWNTGNVTDMSAMFYDCRSLAGLDLSSWDMGKVTDARLMFRQCSITFGKIKTFANLQLDIDLPEGIRYDKKGNEYSAFPKDLPEGIWLYTFDIYMEVESGIVWYITYDGVLTISGEKTEGEPDPDGSAWKAHKDEFTKAVVTAKNIESTAGWFEDCEGLTEVDLSEFDTGKLVKADNMFKGCSGITQIKTFPNLQLQVDLPLPVMYDEYRNEYKTYFPTALAEGIYLYADTDKDVLYSGTESGVTWEITSDGVLTISGEKLAGEKNPDGSAWRAHKGEFTRVVVTAKNIESTANWFSGCSGITEMDLSGFDVSHVTDMTMMFYGCKGLTDLDLSSWNTQNVVKMGYMFGDAQHLVNLDVSGWNTGNVTTMQGMFCNCYSLTSLDLSSWDMGKVTNTFKMFEQCSGITRIKTFANLKLDLELPILGYDEEGNTYRAFPKDLPEGIWLHAYILYKGEESGILWYITHDGELAIGGEKTEGEPDPDGSAWKAHKDEFTKAVIAAKNIESTAGWFEDCEGLTEVDLSGFDTGKLVKADNMFKGCSGITQIKTFPNLQLQIALPLPVMYDEYRNEYKTYFPTDLTEGIYLYADADNNVLYSGTVSGVIWEITSDGVLTISGEKLAGEPNPGGSAWRAHKEEFTKVVITAKNIESTANWFYQCSGITEMDLSGFDVSHVTDMTMMFWGCKGLTALDLSSWSTENVVKMDYMFGDAQNLVNLDVSGWNTGNVKTMQGMFYCCHSLTSLDLSSWDMGKVTNTYKMFEQCRNIGKIKTFANLQLDLELPKGIRFDEKGNKYNAFPKDLPEGIWLYAHFIYEGEESGILWDITYDGVLTILGEKPEGEPDPDGSAWKAHKDEFTKAVVTAKNIESTAGWFEDCEGLVEVDLSGFDTEKLVKADNMFKGCSGITQIKTFPNLQLQIALPLETMYDESDQAYEYFPTDLAQGIILYKERQSSGEKPDPPVKNEGMQVELVQKGDYIYTGSAVKPAVRVYNNGELLTEGTDYTVKYSGNKKVSTANSKAKITVTGKGNLTGSVSTTFDILPKNIGDDDVTVGSIIIAEGSKPAPVLVYNNMKLTAKDYTLSIRGEDGGLTAVSKFMKSGKLVITGRGNYTGEIDVDVIVKSKSELKKFTVIPGKEKLIYNGNEQKISFNVKDIKSGDELKPDEDYIVLYPENITDAGTIKFTVVGMGEYSGSVTKSYSIKPLAAAAGTMKISGVKESGYAFKSTGVTIGEDLTVTCSIESGDIILTEGRDYKLTYSNNKKVSNTNSKAKYTVTFLGSYKGTKAVKGEFIINALPLSDEIDGLKVAVADRVYSGKAGTYVSKPYVTVNGVALKASDYTVKYYKTAERKDGEEISGRNKLALAAEDSEATIYVKIIGKGSYAPASGDTETYLKAEYKVRRTSGEAGKEIYDLSKARVTFYTDEECTRKVTKLEYTGNEVKPFVKVECKEGRNYVTLEKGVDYEVAYVNNVNKGKATVIITGIGDRYAGSRTATFGITAKNLKSVVDFLKGLFNF